MKKLINGLAALEEAVGLFYEEAAKAAGGDRGLGELLARLARDERYHHWLMLKACEVMDTLPDFPPAVVDMGMEINHTLPLKIDACRGLVRDGAIARDKLMRFIVELELAELNDVFLYVIKSLEGHSPSFGEAAARVEQHRKQVLRFVKSNPEYESLIGHAERLPAVRRDNILVVDDSEATGALLAAVLSDEGSVEWAGGGEEALERLAARDYSAVIADVDMPGMNGFEFREAAEGRYPGISGRMVFFTGNADGGSIEYLSRNNLRYLLKPASINEIRRAVIKALDRG